ncbi:MAG: hypothetical protein E6H08_21595 [Bacteroidetes bacterium]|nr:MAG: hypothetical protein E6H08_21595 [Bacteroidota bacterium]
MASYLLLRSNKQTGPFSQEQLIQLGLKPYDLIWVQGKSAAWRYPSEVPELKEYAPLVEEQPYDRFYKKEETVKKEELVLEAEVKSEPILRSSSYSEPVEIKYEKYLPQKNTASPVQSGKVSVIMPKQSVQPKQEEPVFIPAPMPAPKVEEPIIKIIERPVEVETKYSQPLDEIKEMYVRQLQQRKSNSAQKKFIIQTAKKAAIIIGIIGIGVLIGFAIKPKHSPKNDVAAKANTKQQTEPLLSETVQTVADPQIKDPVETIAKKQSQNLIGNNSSGLQPDEIKTVPVEKDIKQEKNEPLNTQQSSEEIVKASINERLKTSRNSETNNESKEKAIIPQNELSKLVSVKTNDYRIGTFGGFHNLQLTVRNDSRYTLDKVLVEVQYLKMNNEPVKIEHIPFQSIEPNAAMTIRIPDNNRGARLTYRILKVESRESNENTAGL